MNGGGEKEGGIYQESSFAKSWMCMDCGPKAFAVNTWSVCTRPRKYRPISVLNSHPHKNQLPAQAFRISSTNEAATTLENADKARVFDTITWSNNTELAKDPNDFDISVQVYTPKYTQSAPANQSNQISPVSPSDSDNRGRQWATHAPC